MKVFVQRRRLEWMEFTLADTEPGDPPLSRDDAIQVARDAVHLGEEQVPRVLFLEPVDICDEEWIWETAEVEEG